MKIVAIIARILLGLMFLVFGLNPFLKFLPMPPLEGAWGQFLGALVVSHYVWFVGAVQVISGALFLIGRYVLCIRLLAMGHHHRDLPAEMLFIETESLRAITAVVEISV